MRPASILKAMIRIIINLIVRGEFTTRMHDIFIEKEQEKKEDKNN